MNIRTLTAVTFLLPALVMLGCNTQPQTPGKAATAVPARGIGPMSPSDSPITVGDGSMLLKLDDTNVKLDDFVEMSGDPKADDVHGVVHPHITKSMEQIFKKEETIDNDFIAVSGANCLTGNPSKCKVVVTWDTFFGSEKEMIISTGRKGKGLIVRTNVPMRNFPGNDPYKWSQNVGAGFEKAEFIKGNAAPILLCRTTKCLIKINICTAVNGACQ
ncbi:MAG: hypothetical protein ACKV22_41565 [Bryobacteraceae bacterium]